MGPNLTGNGGYKEGNDKRCPNDPFSELWRFFSRQGKKLGKDCNPCSDDEERRSEHVS